MKQSDVSIYERFKRIYDEMYTISLCREDEIDDVVTFIDTYWKKDHALVKSRKLLDWQYFNPYTSCYNFVIARSKKTGEIHAIEGFIPTTQFDHSIKHAMTWGAIWKSIPDIAPPGLGFVVKRFRETEFATKYGCEVGISPDAEKYNKQFQNNVYALENWIMINPYIKEHKLMIMPSSDILNNITSNRNVSSIHIGADEWHEVANNVVIQEFKSEDYFLNRYFRHPFYKYYALLLKDEHTGTKEFVFYRFAEHDKSKCIFIVDYIGDGSVLSEAGDSFLKLLKCSNAEYILFPAHGISHQCMINAGFTNRKDSDAVIPTYYEPFLLENIDIVCATPYASVDWMTFKGDSDQDRPNLIEDQHI